MRGNEASLIENANLIWQLVYLDDAPSPVGDAVVVAADRHQAVMADTAFQFEDVVKGQPPPASGCRSPCAPYGEREAAFQKSSWAARSRRGRNGRGISLRQPCRARSCRPCCCWL